MITTLETEQNKEKIHSKYFVTKGVEIDSFKHMVRYTSVKITKNNEVIGSGVIIKSGNGSSSIMTAKHILNVAHDAKVEPDSESVKKDVKANFKIHYYDAQSGKYLEASITSVDYPYKTDWSYDIITLKSNFKTNYTAKIPKPEDVSKYLKLSTWICFPSTFPKDPKPVLVQTGFGLLNEKKDSSSTAIFPDFKDPKVKNKYHPPKTDIKSGSLQIRYPKPINLKPTSFHDWVWNGKTSIHQLYEECILLEADNYDSTAPGDSGGPLFLAQYSKEETEYKFYLIGITGGADIQTESTENKEVKCPSSDEIKKGIYRKNNYSISVQNCIDNVLY